MRPSSPQVKPPDPKFKEDWCVPRTQRAVVRGDATGSPLSGRTGATPAGEASVVLPGGTTASSGLVSMWGNDGSTSVRASRYPSGDAPGGITTSMNRQNGE